MRIKDVIEELRRYDSEIEVLSHVYEDTYRITDRIEFEYARDIKIMVGRLRLMRKKMRHRLNV